MSDEAQKRAITILSTGSRTCWRAASPTSSLDESEERGVADNIKEALAKASFSLASTVVASVIIRRAVSSRWGA